MAEEKEVAAPAKPARSGGWLAKVANAIGILLLVVAGNLISDVVVRDVLPPAAVSKPAEAAGDAVASRRPARAEQQKPPIYLALDPPLVASIDDGQTIRFVQMTVEMMAREQTVLDAVRTHTPVIRNDLLMLVGRKQLSELTSTEGKEQLRAEALQEIRAILQRMSSGGRKESAATVEELYFTSFVVQ